MVHLTTLFPHLDQELDITGLSLDSRTIKPGHLFAALPGQAVDGRDFIDQAIKAGADAILVPSGTRVETGRALLIEDDNPRRAFALACARFFNDQPDLCAAITGTNGKSSCVTFVRDLWQKLSLKAASLGTLGISAPDLKIEGTLTTPDPVALHQNLAILAKNGVTHLAMEASSHGLDQYRMDGVAVQIGAFTNLSRDHLDYHDTMENYFQAKARLFKEVLKEGAQAVLNADIPEFETLKSICDARKIKVLSYGLGGDHIRLVDRHIDGAHQHLSLRVGTAPFKVAFPLAGAFQVENALCALGVVLAGGANPHEATPLLSELSGVPGRMEHVGSHVYVDYAHTPDALETALNSLRPHTRSKLVVMFGCGGDRDRGKRAEMGAIAQKYADRVIVTDDNPRSEDPGRIRRDIMLACPTAQEIGDRFEAIQYAIGKKAAGDVVLLAGKGHESGQILKEKTIPFNDGALARRILQERDAS